MYIYLPRKKNHSPDSVYTKYIPAQKTVPASAYAIGY